MIIFNGVGGGVLARLDPRVRVSSVLLLAVFLYAVPSISALSAAVGLGLALAVAAALPPGWTLRRLAALNLFILVLAATVPLAVPGEVLLRLGGLQWSVPGALRVARIALQANAVMLAAFALLATMDPVRLGFGLRGLGMPSRLTHLFLFTVRYIEVIHQEYHRLADALRLRGFRPRADRHTLRTLGYLVGQLLLRSLDRAARILAAMKCRGFDGRFHLLTRPRLTWVDALFFLAFAAGLAAVGWLA